MDPFVGREPELELLTARLADARGGRPRIVQIQGPPGIGKTALVERFLDTATDTATGVTVVRASGEEGETLLAYGVIDQLARSPGVAGDALLAATRSADAADPVAVGTRLLELLGELEAAGPVVLVVDDLHWADRLSVRALVFALRRLIADQVLVILAVREDDVAGQPESLRRLLTGHRGDVVRLRGLDDRALTALATLLGIESFPAPAAHRLRHETRGNPLHARAVLEEVPTDEWGWSDGRPLPPPRSFRLVVQGRCASCGPDTRRVVDAAAVLGGRTALPLAAELGEVGDPVAAVDEAVARNLLVTSTAQHPWMLSFPHPLVRSAVYDALGPARRSALHTRAATLVEDEAAVLAHRVAAAPAPDAALSQDLLSFARRAAARQAWPSAARHLVESGRLCPDRDEGRDRLLGALMWMIQTGDAASAAVHLADIAELPGSARRDSVLAGLAMAREDPAAAEELLAGAWKRCDADTDDEVVAAIALQTAIHRYGRLDGAGTVEWCRRALEHAAPGTEVGRTARTYLAHALGYSGQRTEAFGAVAGADGDPDDPEVAWLQPRSARGHLRLVEDDLDGARSDLAAVATTAYGLGVLNTAAFAFASLARAEYLAGAWDDAVVHAERAVAINTESDWGFTRAMALGIAALVPAARGEWAIAEAAIAESATRYPGDYERSVVAIAMSTARLAEARGDPAAVVEALEPVRSFPIRDAVDEPGFWAWQDLYAEGLVGVGRAQEADALLRPHEQRAAERGRYSSIARLARARGRVEAACGRPERAAEAFALALDASSRVGLPMERAKAQLAAGQFERRSGQRRRGAELLAAALEAFDTLGAEPYARRCRTEMAASGLRPAKRAHRDGTALTSQELVVSRLAAAGRTNREIAAELVVSVKTVEYHLRNAYQKLGVNRRRQLATRLGDPAS
ncbi:MAG: AAA family ATPase [Pseudonocardia sp.]